MTTTTAPSRDTAASALAVPRQTRSQQGLARMLQAGREMIEASGNLDELSINDIVERAGTSIGAFYRRFDNKDSFFEVVQAAAMEQGLAYLRDTIERDPAWRSDDAATLADAVVAFYVLSFRRNRGLYHASLLRTSQRNANWDAMKATNHEALALIVPRVVSALARERKLPAGETTTRALDFEVRATLQMILGMLVNSVLNDPGPLTLSSRRLRPWLQAQLRRCLALPVD
ncbi:helix-turn-helix domain containing protein [Paraburkholderia xenovorans]|uniref:TetR/AcrR family transcriptional regulator n=1 Tax=Paraburkholderia xenovorans TaxID=36873 RepID=UPI0038BB1667